ncbi:OmpA family protein [Variovorax sp. GB1P17]|uniref:OmpA family protein n=1 Tax=Variovorax sp. GB1P17 TaxID=3443740 RepID=UPI003F481A85
MSTYVDTDLQFEFKKHSVALDAESRTRLAAAVDLARSWCGFELAFVTGHADPSEGESSRSLVELSEARSAYVRQLLGKLGVPKSRIHGEGKGAAQPYSPWPRPEGQVNLPSWSGRAEVYLKAEGPRRKEPYLDGKDNCRDGWTGN